MATEKKAMLAASEEDSAPSAGSADEMNTTDLATEGETKAPEKKTAVRKRKAPVPSEGTSADDSTNKPKKGKKVREAEEENDAASDSSSMEDAISSLEIEGGRIIDENDLGEDIDEIRHNTAFYYPTVAKASRIVRQEMYEGDKDFRREGSDQKTLSPGALRKAEYLELSLAANGNKILTGEVVGVANADTNGNENASTVMAEISYGHDTFLIYIPSYLFFDYPIKQHESAQDKEEIKTRMAKYIGAEIKFCVAYVSEKDGIAYGDRLKACAMRAKRHYIMPENPKSKNGLPKFFTDCIAEGTVIYTAKQCIIVDVGGADVKITVDELDYSYIKDARELYAVGDAIRIKIMEVMEEKVTKYDNKYTLIKVTGSVKRLKKDARPELFAQFKEGGIYKGQIIEIIETGIFVKLKGKYDCLVAPPKYGATPVIGQTRQVRVTTKDPDKLRISGIFISV
ncbi:MAG: hypothetical protein K2K56_14590 [Lachnospiraceae bacterium]|nr:hypothetical protein [Lachnospiraceae bacterium]